MAILKRVKRFAKRKWRQTGLRRRLVGIRGPKQVELEALARKRLSNLDWLLTKEPRVTYRMGLKYSLDAFGVKDRDKRESIYKIFEDLNKKIWQVESENQAMDAAEIASERVHSITGWDRRKTDDFFQSVAENVKFIREETDEIENKITEKRIRIQKNIKAQRRDMN
ncbi:MAG: hypothetical protein Q7K34_03910 [archaeon]|nr:hypothetical protein [archaeon]